MDFKFLIWLLSGTNSLVIRHFLVVGAFSLKFSIAPSGETIDRGRFGFSGPFSTFIWAVLAMGRFGRFATGNFIRREVSTEDVRYGACRCRTL